MGDVFLLFLKDAMGLVFGRKFAKNLCSLEITVQ